MSEATVTHPPKWTFTVFQAWLGLAYVWILDLTNLLPSSSLSGGLTLGVLVTTPFVGVVLVGAGMVGHGSNLRLALIWAVTAVLMVFLCFFAWDGRFSAPGVRWRVASASGAFDAVGVTAGGGATVGDRGTDIYVVRHGAPVTGLAAVNLYDYVGPIVRWSGDRQLVVQMPPGLGSSKARSTTVGNAPWGARIQLVYQSGSAPPPR